MNGVKMLRKNPREVIKTIAPNHKVFSTIKNLPFPLKSRHFIYECVWERTPNGNFVFAFRRPHKKEDFSDIDFIDIGKNASRQLVKADSRGFVIIKPTGKHGNDSCEVTWVQQADAMGNIPRKIMERQIPRGLKLFTQVREKFCRDDEIDRIDREKLMAMMRNAADKEGGEVYDKSETELIKKVQQQIGKASDDIFWPLNR